MADQTETGRKLRLKERKHYSDVDLDDEEIEGKRTFSIDEKLRSEKFTKYQHVRSMKGEDFNYKFIQEDGLKAPIIFLEKTGLGLRVPSTNFQVSDVKQCVGSRRVLDVMDVNTQKGMEMTMKEWVKYYENTEREKLLNVISLEFSHTRLENYVESPTLVRQIDWVDTVWPRHLKQCQTESTNIIEKMKYPKVQKYCLMSVAGCYTDFHMDFGGTSVWYHILHGEKVFWLIPPTEENVDMYEKWVLSGKQGDVFLGDKADKCERLSLVAGSTFIIPAGWIHAVYTPKDSLVFGGNYIHSFNIPMQLRVSEVEDRTHVPQKFRYPFYHEIMWYLIERYVHCLTGKSYVTHREDSVEPDADNFLHAFKLDADSRPPSSSPEEKLNGNTASLSKSVKIELTRIDESQLKVSPSDDEGGSIRKSPRKTSVGSSSSLDDKSEVSGKFRSRSADNSPSTSKENLKSGKGRKVKDEMDTSLSADSSRKDPKKVFLTRFELEGLALILEYLDKLAPTKKGIPKDLTDPQSVVDEMKRLLAEHKEDDPTLAISGEQVITWPVTKQKIKVKSKFKTPSAKSKGTGKGSSPSGGRRRRTRCRKCEACIRDDCGECNFCKDMKKYGGPGRMKQTCVSRQCMAPVLPHTAVCMICWSDDRQKLEDQGEETVTTLMECGICWEIVHPDCLRTKYENLDNDGNINEDLPNSWECLKCCHDGKQGQLKPRVKKQSKSKTVSHDDEDTEDANTSINGIEGKRVTSKVGLSPKGKASSKIQSGAELVKKKYGKFKKMELQRKRKLSSNSPHKSTDSSNGHQEDSPVKKPSKRSRLSEPLPQRRPVSLPHKNVLSSPESLSPDTPSRRPRREGVVYNSPDDKTGTPHSRKRRFRKTGIQRTPDTSPDLPRSTSSQTKGKRRQKRKDNYEISPSTSLNVITDIADSSDTLVDTPPSLASKRVCKPEFHSNPGPFKLKEVSVVLERYIVRPAPLPPPPDFVISTDGSDHVLDRIHWMLIFSFLPQPDLSRCLAVCKTWNRWCNHPSLWKLIDLSKKRIQQAHLKGIVRHQPQSLTFASSVLTQKQIDWLMARLPQLKSLNVSKLSWAIICGLCSSNCPLLRNLNLSWATAITDNCIRDLVSPPVNRRPGMKDSSRLHCLEHFCLAGTEITDATLAFIPGQLKNLTHLDFGYCVLVTDEGIISLLGETSCLRKTVRELNLPGCKKLTENCLTCLYACERLTKVTFTSCPQISFRACKENLRHFQQKNLIVTSDKIICRA